MICEKRNEARQKELVNLWVGEFRKIFNKPADPSAVYDRLPLSARTTFEAVTHALSRSQMTSGSGKLYGTASAISIKAYPCVAEFTDGSRPDSKIALLRILNQLQQVNQRFGKSAVWKRPSLHQTIPSRRVST